MEAAARRKGREGKSREDDARFRVQPNSLTRNDITTGTVKDENTRAADI